MNDNGTVYFGEYNLPMFKTYYNLGDTYLDIYLSSKDISLDYIENIVQFPKNLKHIQILDEEQQPVIKFDNKFTVYDTLCVLPFFKYGEDEEHQPLYTKVIKLTLIKPTPETAFQQMQATMEYIAIMSDIDIDEEI